MINYKINSTHITIDNRRHITYGIDVYDNDTLLSTIADLSIDKALVEDILSKCNIYNAAPEHIMDIIYDSIG